LTTQKLTFLPIKANFVYEVLRNYTDFALGNSSQVKVKCYFCVANLKALSSFILDII